ncbi:hypothetical protein [Hoeflea sp.]|uniref:hypothetical protein n=1 Tax=Hoeflea sp. TaxID=1940281 RepID=UPI003B5204AB
MRKLIAAAVPVVGLTTGQTLAHTGDHSALTVSEMGAHLASWPDHLAIILIAALCLMVGLGAKRLSSVKRRK